MPGKSQSFTPSSILFHPHQMCLALFVKRYFALSKAHLVEVPGTAPGSDRFIAISVYHHSWPEGQHLQYREFCGKLKVKCLKWPHTLLINCQTSCLSQVSGNRYVMSISIAGGYLKTRHVNLYVEIEVLK